MKRYLIFIFREIKYRLEGKDGSWVGDGREADSSDFQRASRDALKMQRFPQKGTEDALQ